MSGPPDSIATRAALAAASRAIVFKHRGASRYRGSARGILLATIIYLFVILFASLSPFIGWHKHTGLSFLLTWSRYYTRSDVVINLIGYIPLGFFLALAVPQRGLRAGIVASAAGFALSLSLEALQGYLPGRVSSPLDLLMNSLGTVIGAAIALRWGERSVDCARRARLWFLPGRHADLGLALLALWFALQLAPSLPLFGNAYFDAMRRPLPDLPPWGFSLPHVGFAMLQISSVGLLLITVLRLKKFAAPIALMMMATAIVIKFIAMIAVTSAAFPLTLEGMIGGTYGVLLLATAARLKRELVIPLCALMIITVVALGCLEPLGKGYVPASWLIDQRYRDGLYYKNIAWAGAQLWPLIALGYLVRSFTLRRQAGGAKESR